MSPITTSELRVVAESEIEFEFTKLPDSATALVGMTITRSCDTHKTIIETFRT